MAQVEILQTSKVWALIIETNEIIKICKKKQKSILDTGHANIASLPLFYLNFFSWTKMIQCIRFFLINSFLLLPHKEHH